jgi:hypothetical protein
MTAEICCPVWVWKPLVEQDKEKVVSLPVDYLIFWPLLGLIANYWQVQPSQVQHKVHKLPTIKLAMSQP